MQNNYPPRQNYPQQNQPQNYRNQMNYSNPQQTYGYGQNQYPNNTNFSNNGIPPIPTNLPYPGVNLPPYVQPQGQSGYGMNPNVQPPYGYQSPNMSYNPYQRQQTIPVNTGYPPQRQQTLLNQQNSSGQQSPYKPQVMGNPNVMLKNLVIRFSDTIFMKYDANRSGFLDVKEIYPAVCELFATCGIPQPSYPDVIALMREFDKDGNGLIDMAEFRTIMLLMNGF